MGLLLLAEPDRRMVVAALARSRKEGLLFFKKEVLASAKTSGSQGR